MERYNDARRYHRTWRRCADPMKRISTKLVGNEIYLHWRRSLRQDWTTKIYTMTMTAPRTREAMNLLVVLLIYNLCCWLFNIWKQSIWASAETCLDGLTLSQKRRLRVWCRRVVCARTQVEWRQRKKSNEMLQIDDGRHWEAVHCDCATVTSKWRDELDTSGSRRGHRSYKRRTKNYSQTSCGTVNLYSTR